MRRVLTLKGIIALAAVAVLMAGAAAYATHLPPFDVSVTGNVTLLTTGDAIQILSGDGVTPIESGDTLDFGTAQVDFLGRGPVPVRGPFTVKNLSNGPVQVMVMGDFRDDIVPLWGPTPGDLKPLPDNAFTLAAPGMTGDTMTGYLGLSFLAPSSGSKSTTIIFRATEAPLELARIAFSSDRDGDDEIYVMDAVDADGDGNGDSLSRLTSEDAFDGYPVWSLDGSKIAFYSDRDGDREIYVMDVVDADGDGDGDSLTRLTSGDAFDAVPDWSPDGDKLVFTSNRDGNYEIYVMDAVDADGDGNGDSLARLTSGDAFDFFPVWSPNGGKVAFQSNRDGDLEIYVMDAVDADGDGNGDSLTHLTSGDAFDGVPDWSPDGDKIAFTSGRDGDFEIYVMDAVDADGDGNGDSLARLASGDAFDCCAAWSPDGNKIAFESFRDGDREIYVMDAVDADGDGNGDNLARLTSGDASDCCAAWSPGVVPAVIGPAIAAISFSGESGSLATPLGTPFDLAGLDPTEVDRAP